LRLRSWKKKFRPTEVEKPLTEEEEVELRESTWRFDILGPLRKSWYEDACERRLQKRNAVQIAAPETARDTETATGSEVNSVSIPTRTGSLTSGSGSG
jgi:hypothetical protein